MRGLFVTGTDTGVGKTVLSAALLAAMIAAGERVRAHKPVVTGLEEPSTTWPPDHELLAAAAGMTPEDVAPLRYGPAVSPHLAAQLAGERVDPATLLAAAQAAAKDTTLIVGGAFDEDEQPISARASASTKVLIIGNIYHGERAIINQPAGR